MGKYTGVGVVDEGVAYGGEIYLCCVFAIVTHTVTDNGKWYPLVARHACPRVPCHIHCEWSVNIGKSPHLLEVFIHSCHSHSITSMGIVE